EKGPEYHGENHRDDGQKEKAPEDLERLSDSLENRIRNREIRQDYVSPERPRIGGERRGCREEPAQSTNGAQSFDESGMKKHYEPNPLKRSSALETVAPCRTRETRVVTAGRFASGQGAGRPRGDSAGSTTTGARPRDPTARAVGRPRALRASGEPVPRRPPGALPSSS